LPLFVRASTNQRQIMSEQLTFKLITHNENQSDYDWMNIERNGIRVGKMRGLIKDKTLTINSINIFPEFEGRGFARKTIRMFKKSFDTIIADRVRHTAVGFWEKMKFDPDGNGNYIWRNKEQYNHRIIQSKVNSKDCCNELMG